MNFLELLKPAPKAAIEFPLQLHDISWSGLASSRLIPQLLACLAICCALLVNKSALYHFPGPPAWPIIGNLPSLYHRHAERQFFEWSKKYGDVIRVQLGYMTILVVNSAAAAKPIFTGSATALSSRPVFHTFHKVSYLFIDSHVGSGLIDQ